MKYKKCIYAGVAIVVAVVAFMGVRGSAGFGHTRVSGVGESGVGDPKEVIRIGGSISLTGVAAEFGDMSKKAMEMAADEINERGGIKGRKVEIHIEDDQTTPQGALSAYHKLVDIDHVDALIGGIFDFTAHPIFPLSEHDQIAFISPVNFVMDKTFEMTDQSFVMYPQFDTVVMKLDSIIKGKGIRKLGMIRFESGFGESIQNTLKKIMSSMPGGKGGMFVDTYNAIGTSDFRTNILKVHRADVDAVFLDMLDFDVVKYLDVARTLVFDKKIIGYTSLREVVTNPKTKPEDVRDLEGAIILDWEVPSKAFSDAFYAKYGTVPLRGADKSYDAVYALAESIAHASSSADVASYLETHEFNTMNGSFSFGSDHAVADISVKVFEVRNGALADVSSGI